MNIVTSYSQALFIASKINVPSVDRISCLVTQATLLSKLYDVTVDVVYKDLSNIINKENN